MDHEEFELEEYIGQITRAVQSSKETLTRYIKKR